VASPERKYLYSFFFFFSFASASAWGLPAGVESTGGGGCGGALHAGAGGLSPCKGTQSDKTVIFVTLAVALGFDLAFFLQVFLPVDVVRDCEDSTWNHLVLLPGSTIRSMSSRLPESIVLGKSGTRSPKCKMRDESNIDI
jgi:hypothetical protein